MAKWFFEPGHTAAEFCARHMMVTWVRGHFKNVRGSLIFERANPLASSVEVEIDAKGLWTGEADRDAHLRSADFLDADNYPTITFKGSQIELVGENDATVTGALTIRGVTKSVALAVRYLGQWQTPWWEDGMDKGPKTRAGFWPPRRSTGSISVSAGTPLWKTRAWSSAIRSKSRSMPRRFYKAIDRLFLLLARRFRDKSARLVRSRVCDDGRVQRIRLPRAGEHSAVARLHAVLRSFSMLWPIPRSDDDY